MRLLFDENLAPRLVALVADLFPGSLHVSSIELGSIPDEYSPGRSAEGGPGANRQFLHGTNRKYNPSNAVRLSEFEHDSKRGLLIFK